MDFKLSLCYSCSYCLLIVFASCYVRSTLITNYKDILVSWNFTEILLK